MKYVSLHHHTTFSYMDGYGKPDAHHERAAELEMNALAATEHGNTSSHVQHEKAGKKYGVKPIFGLEAYTAPADMRETKNQRKWHLTVLAADQAGYTNLNEVVRRSWAEGFYRWPTVTGDILQDHHKGLIILSGCADSLLACTMLGGKGIPEPDGDDGLKAAYKVAGKFKSLLGDRYYLECQQFPELPRSIEINTRYAKMSKDLGIPLVATADCHYPRPDDNEMQKVLHAAGRNTGTVAAAEAEWEYDIRLTLPTSDDFITKRLMQTGLSKSQAQQAVENTALIADRCNVVLPKSETIRYPLPAGYIDSKALIWDWLRRGWKYRWERNAHMRKNKQAYLDRMQYEMDLVELKGYMDYFLMLSDAVSWAKDNGIPVGPARGSAAASLVCYLLRITEVDPMQFPTMMFERFIDAKREDLPDVDLDFADDRRDEVRLHLVDIYGADHVGNIGNFTRYRGKNAVNDVARVHQIPKWEATIVNDLVIERSGGDSRFDASLGDTRDMFPAAKAIFDKYPILEQAIALEGNYKGMGVHAAGIVVSNKPITDTCAVYQRDNVGKDKKTLQVIAYDKKDAEYLGMLKADFLGLTTMGMISRALGLINMSLDALYQVPLDDPKTIDAFRRGDVIGIFQFEGRATRLMTMDVKPDTFMEIADINALSRPGPLFSGASATYVDIKHGLRTAEHLHPIVDKYTKSSQYQIIYQEQVLGIIREMGGFPVAKVADIRKIISQKLGEASFNEMREEFIKGAKQHHGVEEQLADKIWKLMVTSATYSFNIAHCISYGMLAFWAMWLKVHHTAAFYAAQLSKIKPDKKGQPKIAALIKDASTNAEKFERVPLKVLPPDIAISGETWDPHPELDGVVAGFMQVPGIAEASTKLITTYIKDCGKSRDELKWGDLIAVKGIGPKTIDKIEKWTASDDPFKLWYAQRVLGDFRDAIKARHVWPSIKPNFTSDEIPRDADNLWVAFMGIPKFREYKDYIEDERARSGKPLDEIMAGMDRPDLVKGCVLKCYDDGDEEVYLRFNRFNFPKFQTMLEAVKIDGTQIIIAEGMKRKGFGINVQVKNMIVFDVNEGEDEEEDELDADG